MSLKVLSGFSILLVVTLLLPACQAAGSQPVAAALPSVTQVSTATAATATQAAPTATPVPQASVTPQPTPAPAIWLAPYLPSQLRSKLQLPTGWQITGQPETAMFIVDLLPDATGQHETPASSVAWIYVLVAPFPTVTDQVTFDDLMQLWNGQRVTNLEVSTLLVDESTRAVLSTRWGKPGSLVRTVPAEQRLARAWASQDTWAILPFEELEPRWKVIAVDEQNPLQKTFDSTKYGLTVHFGLLAAQEQTASLPVEQSLAESNRVAERLTTVMLTGVTAMVRGTASWMEYYGSEYPAMFIGDWLREADILHINNEVPFAKKCPDPYPWEGLVFCSRPKYIGLLESIGTDVIDLSGDHFQDWGEEAMLLTLDLYDERGWPYYGGGRNREEAQQPALFEHNGNKIAFLGCNAKPPGYAGADDDSPGAVHCDFDQLTGAVKKVRAEGYLPIVTFQHLEYYRYEAHPILQADFKKVAEAGAVIVSGSQAHQPHAIDFLESSDQGQGLSFLHYGLGNLFFDQVYEGYPNRQAFIDRHVIYEGRHIGTELLTIFFIDLARARPMTPEERTDLLNTIFKASGWKK